MVFAPPERERRSEHKVVVRAFTPGALLVVARNRDPHLEAQYLDQRLSLGERLGDQQTPRLQQPLHGREQELFPVGEALTNLTRPAFPTTGIGPQTMGDEN